MGVISMGARLRIKYAEMINETHSTDFDRLEASIIETGDRLCHCLHVVYGVFWVYASVG